MSPSLTLVPSMEMDLDPDPNLYPDLVPEDLAVVVGWRAMDADEKRLFSSALNTLVDGMARDAIVARFEADLAALRSGGILPPLSYTAWRIEA